MTQRVNSSFLMASPPPWAAVTACAPAPASAIASVVLPLVRMERIGDTTASGADFVIVPADDDEADPAVEVGVYRDGGEMPEDIAPAHSIEYGLARIQEENGLATVVVRTPTGEYRACMLMPRSAQSADDQLRLHAILYQRQRMTRDTALPVPVHAGALQRVVAGGRDTQARSAAVTGRLKAKLDITFDTERRERVTVEVVLPKVRAVRLRLNLDDPLLPGLADEERQQLPALVGEALARVLPVRAYQAVLAGMSLVYRDGGVELDDKGELSDTFRLAVMRVMGMPSRAASKAQREVVRGAMEFLVHAEMLVRPVGGKKPDYLPILVRTRYADDPNAKERRARRLMLNPEILPDMDSGRRWLVPEALVQVPDEADRDGVLRLIGLQLAHRLGMGTSGRERLELMLRRAGLWEWAQRQHKAQRGTYVLDTLRTSLDRLRALPHQGHAPSDIVGGTVIVGHDLGDAVVEYRDAPAWAHSSA